MNAPYVTIGILHHKRLACLKRCINSIIEHTKMPYKLLIVCQGVPKTRTKNYLQKLEDQDNVNVVHFAENKGIGYGKKYIAQEAKTPYIFFMDNDVEVTRKWLQPLVKHLEDNTELGAVSPLYYYYGIELQNSGGRIKKVNDILTKSWFSEEALKHVNSNTLIFSDFLAAAAVLIRREVFKEVMFDPNYFIGYDELDLWLQIKKTRWKLAFCKRSKVYHKPHSSIFDYFSYHRNVRWNQEILNKSRRYFFKKHKITKLERIGTYSPSKKVKLRAILHLIKGSLT